MIFNLDALLERLPEQRWFGGKGRTPASVTLVDHGVLDDGPPALVLALARVVYVDEGVELYHLPLLVQEDGSIADAFEDPARLSLFGELLAHGVSIKGEHGVFAFNGPGMDPLQPPGAQSVRSIAAEQTNTSLVLDDRFIVKLFRRIAPGPNPDLELSRVLTTKGFEHTPGHAGELSYEGEIDGEEIVLDLAIAQPFLPDMVEGWVKTLEAVRELYDQIHEADIAEDRRVLTEERAADMLETIAELGDATAGLHIALTREETEPDFVPETIQLEDLVEWSDSALVSLARELEVNPDIEPLAEAVKERLEALRTVDDPGMKTRIHGDYHLGQVLYGQRGWMLIDFEGEPARTLEERRAKQSPLRDVAGMIRSFSYATLQVLFERAEPDTDEWQRLQPWAECFESLAVERFLHAYLSRAHEGTFIPAARENLTTMLDAFVLDKALYELGYERSHRPGWIRIPMQGITRVLEGEA